MASMGIFSAMMYRQHLHDVVLAKAKELNPNMSEEELKKVHVPLPKKVSYTLKAFLQPSHKVIITAMVATDKLGADMPCFVWHCEDPVANGVASFEQLPNHTMHRILDLLKPAEPKKEFSPAAALFDELATPENAAIYRNY